MGFWVMNCRTFILERGSCSSHEIGFDQNVRGYVNRFGYGFAIERGGEFHQITRFIKDLPHSNASKLICTSHLNTYIMCNGNKL